jgi:S1-C subfamily serine protease
MRQLIPEIAADPGNMRKLIINTAIATPTGVYAGYAFAIPVDIVKKVTNDLMNYGAVQRAVLGISIRDLNSVLAKKSTSTVLTEFMSML